MDIEVLRDVLLPIATLVIGWLTSAYRNRQQKERSILDNVQQVLDMKTTEVDRAHQELDRAQTINEKQDSLIQRLSDKLDKKDKAIRRSRTCEWVRGGHDCPVTEYDETMPSAVVQTCLECNKTEDNQEESND